MIKIEKHIAIVLFGIFIFPGAFQSVHFVRHYNLDQYACHHVCNIHNDIHTTKISATKSVNICPLCEYKFPVNTIPVVSVYEADIPITKFVFNETIRVHPYLGIFEMNFPRAPPLWLK